MGKLEASPRVQETSDGRWTPLLEACFAEFTEAEQEGDAVRTTPLVRALASLALIARGIITPASRRGQQALRVGRLALAR